MLLPFLTLKPLEVSLVEAEHAAAAASEPAQPSSSPSSPTDAAGAAASSGGARYTGSFGPWRTPQRASTSYVRCLYHAVNFILTRRRGVSALRCKQVGLALRLQMVEMIRNDLDYMHPDDNGHKVCLMAFRQLSYRAVKIADALDSEETASTPGAKRPDSTCSICLEDMDKTASDVVTLPCSHTFHRQVRECLVPCVCWWVASRTFFQRCSEA